MLGVYNSIERGSCILNQFCGHFRVGYNFMLYRCKLQTKTGRADILFHCGATNES